MQLWGTVPTPVRMAINAATVEVLNEKGKAVGENPNGKRDTLRDVPKRTTMVLN